jgi:hypothetical protein
MFEKSFSVDFTTPVSEKQLRENKGFGVCDLPPELHLRLNLTLFKHPLNPAPIFQVRSLIILETKRSFGTGKSQIHQQV